VLNGKYRFENADGTVLLTDGEYVSFSAAQLPVRVEALAADSSLLLIDPDH